MKKMKRAFAALLALCCVLPLAACGLNISEKPADPTDDPAPAPTAQTAKPGYALALASRPAIRRRTGISGKTASSTRRNTTRYTTSGWPTCRKGTPP